MAKLLVLLIFSVISGVVNASAETAGKTLGVISAESSATDLKNTVGLAIIPLSDEQNSISRDSRTYQRIIGNLQKQIRKNDFYVFNAVLPADHQPDWALGLEAVRQTIETIDNPHINTMIMVNATVVAGLEGQTIISLHLRLLDVSTQTVYRELYREQEMVTAGDETDRFAARHLENELVALSKSLLPDVIKSVHEEYEVGESVLHMAER